MKCDLYPGARPCLQCGWCCKQGICPFGEWDEASHRCRFLTADNLCQKYEEIIQYTEQEFSPAFGAGCCSALNGDRLAIINKR